MTDKEQSLSPAEQTRLNAAAKSWLERRDPVAQELTAPPFADKNAEKRKAETAKFQQRIAEHNAELIRREWVAAGLEPQPYSFELARLLKPKASEDAA